MTYSERDREFLANPDKQLALLQKFVDEFDQEYAEKAKSHKKSKKKSSSKLPQVDPLFSQPPDQKESKEGRVKYVTNNNEQIPYPFPTPDAIAQNGDMTMQTTTLTIDFSKGPFSNLINGDKKPVDVPEEECPYFNKKIRFV